MTQCGDDFSKCCLQTYPYYVPRRVTYNGRSFYPTKVAKLLEVAKGCI